MCIDIELLQFSLNRHVLEEMRIFKLCSISFRKTDLFFRQDLVQEYEPSRISNFLMQSVCFFQHGHGRKGWSSSHCSVIEKASFEKFCCHTNQKIPTIRVKFQFILRMWIWEVALLVPNPISVSTACLRLDSSLKSSFSVHVREFWVAFVECAFGNKSLQTVVWKAEKETVQKGPFIGFSFWNCLRKGSNSNPINLKNSSFALQQLDQS